MQAHLSAQLVQHVVQLLLQLCEHIGGLRIQFSPAHVLVDLLELHTAIYRSSIVAEERRLYHQRDFSCQRLFNHHQQAIIVSRKPLKNVIQDMECASQAE